MSWVVFSVVVALLCHDVVVVGAGRLHERDRTRAPRERVREEQEHHQDGEGGQTHGLGVHVPRLVDEQRVVRPARIQKRGKLNIASYNYTNWGRETKNPLVLKFNSCSH